MLTSNDVTKAIETAFNTDPAFEGRNICRSDTVNTDPELCPWVGIYGTSIVYDPETLGQGPEAWTGAVTLTIVAQEVNYSSGAEVEDSLNALVELVINKLFSDLSIRGIVDIVKGVDVTYSYVIGSETEELYFQSAFITVETEVSTS